MRRSLCPGVWQVCWVSRVGLGGEGFHVPRSLVMVQSRLSPTQISAQGPSPSISVLTSRSDMGVLSSSGRCCSRARTMQLAMMVARIMYSKGVWGLRSRPPMALGLALCPLPATQPNTSSLPLVPQALSLSHPYPIHTQSPASLGLVGGTPAALRPTSVSLKMFLLAFTSYTSGSYSSPLLSPSLCVPFQASPLVLLLISFPSFPPFLFSFLSEFKVAHRSTGTSS